MLWDKTDAIYQVGKFKELKSLELCLLNALFY